MKRMHASHLMVLFAILVLGIAAFLYVSPNVTSQLYVGIATAVTYVAWGLAHHSMRGDLHQKIVVEYLLIGAIAIVLLVTMLGF